MEDSGTPVKQQVVVTDVQMPFLSMVRFMVKWAFASIPAAVILIVVAFLVGLLLSVAGWSISEAIRTKAFGRSKPALSERPAVPAVKLTPDKLPTPTTEPQKAARTLDSEWAVTDLGLEERGTVDGLATLVYEFTVVNDGDGLINVDATVELKGENDQVVDVDVLTNLTVFGGTKQTFTRTIQLPERKASQIEKIGVSAKRND